MKDIVFSDYDMNRRSSLMSKLCSKSALTAMVLMVGLVCVYWLSVQPTHYERGLAHGQDLKWLQTLIDSKLLKDDLKDKEGGKRLYGSTTTGDYIDADDWGDETPTATTTPLATNIADKPTYNRMADFIQADNVISTSPQMRHFRDNVIHDNIDQQGITTTEAWIETDLRESSVKSRPKVFAAHTDAESKRTNVDNKFDEWLNKIRENDGVGQDDDSATDRRNAILRQLGFGSYDNRKRPTDRVVTQAPQKSYSTSTNGYVDDKTRAKQNLYQQRIGDTSNSIGNVRSEDSKPYQEHVAGVNIGDIQADKTPYQERIAETDVSSTDNIGPDTISQRQSISKANQETVGKIIDTAGENVITDITHVQAPVNDNIIENNGNIGPIVGNADEGTQSIIRGNMMKRPAIQPEDRNLIQGPVSKISSQINETKTAVREQTEQPYIVRPIPNQYSDNINIYNWNTPLETDEASECVPMQTISSYVRVCIHPLHEDGDMSTLLKGRGSWEFTGVRDVQLAILKLGDDSGFIDIGASIGVYSLAVASLKRQVIAVEPYLPHIQMFQRSMILNTLQPYVTLVRNVVSDTHTRMMVEHLPGHLNHVNVHAYNEDVDRPQSNAVEAITLNDLSEIVSFKRVVLKIDIPHFVHAAFKQSSTFFSKLDVKYVFMHWDTSDTQLCQYVLSFFTDKNYMPFLELNGKSLNIREAYDWPYKSVIWAKK